ncbi:alpha/beta-type small acid-soluble spore protein [Bacillus sp. RG28]|uniref:Alpha/beta-type small acid-soluble spore protein n=1 Tax=Gottfriedia endophytica TaxID=2820819 RepID=A0A940NMH7_9BACI|nr:alpha/beta-type small acid-soluble spore protein [Gottfriedia endophytica]
MARKNKLLVPESKAALDQLKAQVVNVNNPENAKFEAAKEVGVSLNKGYNGQISAKEAGQVGGRLGGSMVKELIKIAQENLRKKHNY